jgi:hypothetical protein
MRLSLPGIHDVVRLWVLCLLRSLPNLVVLLEVATVEELQGNRDSGVRQALQRQSASPPNTGEQPQEIVKKQ